MANFYTDNPDLKHHLTHPLMEKIVALKERNYTDAEKYDYAPSTTRTLRTAMTRSSKS